jgi:predicted phage terminase large subunit-like protein
MTFGEISDEVLRDRILIAEYAQHDLLAFAQLLTPDPLDAVNPKKSKFQWKAHHRLIADGLQEIEGGRLQAFEVELPPRYGKTQLAVRTFVPWHCGKHPDRDLLVVTATDTLANEHGRDVRELFNSPGYKTVFGHDSRAMLRSDSQSVDRLQLVGGAKILFSGRGGLPAGVGGYGIVFDDFFKSAEEAFSPTERDRAWRSFVADCLSRLNDSKAWRLIIGSRKHEDDVQGRLFDVSNVHYDEPQAKQYKRIRIPALSEGKETDVLLREKDEVCWPEKFPKEFYIAKRNNASPFVRMDFQIQDQCNPVAEEGDYFKKEWLKTWTPDGRGADSDLPQFLVHYGASDHALRKKQVNDFTCLLHVAIDPVDRIFIMPDTVWDKLATDVMVERMLDLMERNKTELWWAARDQISGSIEPFLKKRQRERNIYRLWDDSISETTDLMQRGRSIQARMAMGMVYFPKHWVKWGEAETQMLAFPNGKFDDFCAALAMLGMGLDRHIKPSTPRGVDLPQRGTWSWHNWKPNWQGDKDKVAGWA